MKAVKISTYPLKLKSFSDQKKVFDVVRNKYVVFTPEEFVRQSFIQYLIIEKGYSKNLMGIEYPLRHLDTTLRSDIVIFDVKGKARIIIECKAPHIKMSDYVVEQAALYNSKLHVNYVIVTNGKESYCCQLEYDPVKIYYLNQIPERQKIEGIQI